MVKNVFKKLGKKQKNNKGFSLVELIVVIAIMALLLVVIAQQLIKYTYKHCHDGSACRCTCSTAYQVC